MNHIVSFGSGLSKLFEKGFAPPPKKINKKLAHQSLAKMGKYTHLIAVTTEYFYKIQNNGNTEYFNIRYYHCFVYPLKMRSGSNYDYQKYFFVLFGTLN